MKPKYVPLKKLSDKSKDYTVKVKVIQKAPPKQLPQKNRYQRMILKDDEGTTMQATLFNDDIDSFEQALQRNGEYELSGATIQPVPAQYQIYAGEYQMNFNDRVKIKPLNLRSCCDAPQYTKLVAVTEAYTHEDEIFDVLAIVIHVDVIRTIKKNDTKQQVRDITIVDDSMHRPLKLSAWNNVAAVDCEHLSSSSHNFPIVGFIGVRKATFKGISLATTMSTYLVTDPEGAEAEALYKWTKENSSIITGWQSKVLLVKDSSTPHTITPVEVIEKKKANNVWQDEKFWIKVTLPSIYPKGIYCYVGCDKCGRRAHVDTNTTFNCIHCNSKKALSVPRVSFSFYASDGTGVVRLTAFGKEVEAIMGLSSVDIHNLKNNEDQTALEKKIAEVEHKEIILQIGPTSSLSTSYVLKWVVRSVEVAATT